MAPTKYIIVMHAGDWLATETKLGVAHLVASYVPLRAIYQLDTDDPDLPHIVQVWPITGDTPEDWEKTVAHVVQQSTGFVECPECARNPGSPVLCPSCLHNRSVIEGLSSCLDTPTDKQIEIALQLIGHDFHVHTGAGPNKKLIDDARKLLLKALNPLVKAE